MIDFNNRDLTYTGAKTKYQAGRFSFILPSGYQPDMYRFRLTPAQQLESGKVRTSRIEIEEHPWKHGENELEFEQLWRPLQQWKSVASEETYSETFKDGGKVYAENLDASSYFGHKAVTIGYINDGFPYPINSFIVLPQGVLALREMRRMGNVDSPNCTRLEGPAAELFKHYTWKKNEPSQEDTYYTALGMVEGYHTEQEYTILSVVDGVRQISISVEMEYDVHSKFDPELDRLPSEAEVRQKAEESGVEYEQIVNGSRKVASREMIEKITKLRSSNSDEPYVLDFVLRTPPGQVSTANTPNVMITLQCGWEHRKQAIPVWNTLLGSFSHVWPHN